MTSALKYMTEKEKKLGKITLAVLGGQDGLQKASSCESCSKPLPVVGQKSMMKKEGRGGTAKEMV